MSRKSSHLRYWIRATRVVIISSSLLDVVVILAETISSQSACVACLPTESVVVCLKDLLVMYMGQAIQIFSVIYV